MSSLAQLEPPFVLRTDLKRVSREARCIPHSDTISLAPIVGKVVSWQLRQGVGSAPGLPAVVLRVASEGLPREDLVLCVGSADQGEDEQEEWGHGFQSWAIEDGEEMLLVCSSSCSASLYNGDTTT